MKKIMKKALGIVLAFALVIVLAPMASKASELMTGELATDGSFNTVLFDGDEKYECTWTPEADTTYTFTFYEEDWVIEIYSPITGSDAWGSFNCSSGAFSYDVYAGVTYTLSILNTTWQPDDINFTIEEGALEGSSIEGSGTEYDPYIVTAATELPALGFGETAYYMLTGLEMGKEYSVTVRGGAMMDAFQVSVPWTEIAADAMMGYATIQVTGNMRGGAMFCITNYNRGNGGPYTLAVEDVVGEPGTTPENPIAVDADEPYVVVPVDGGLVYYAVPVDADAYYTLTLWSRQMGVEFDAYLYNARMGQFGYYGFAVNGLLEVTDPIYADSDTIVVGIMNMGGEDAAIMILATEYEFSSDDEGGEEGGEIGGEEGGEDYEAPLGSYDNMDSLEFDYPNPTDITDGMGYWYTLPEITEDGMITIFPSDEEGCPLGFYVGVYVEGEEGYEWITDNNGMDPFDFDVKAGDKVAVYVHNGEFDFDADVDFTVYYTEGASAEGGDDEDGEEEGGEELNYELSGLTFLPGTNTYPVSNMFPYTVFYFEPAEAGIYTITAEDAVIGIVGYMWVNDYQVNAEYVNGTTIEWPCTAVGQSVYVAVMAETGTVTITLDVEEYVEETIEVNEYENTVDPEDFVLEMGEDDELVYFADLDEVPTIEKGEDGFYYTENGELVLVHIGAGAPLVALADLPNYGQAKYYESATEVIDYNAAVLAYVATMDENGLVPVTDDIIEFYTKIGAFQGWYEENGFAAGYDYTFAFAYVEVAEEDDTIEDDSNIEEDTEDEEIKDTGDATANMIAMIVLLGGALLVTGFVAKKRLF